LFLAIRKSIAFEYKDGSVYHGDWNDARVLLFFFLIPQKKNSY